MFRMKSYQHKLFLYYSIFIISTLTVLISVLFIYISNVFLNNEKTRMLEKAQSILYKLDSTVSVMDTISLQVLFSEDLQNIMTELNISKENDVNYFEYDLDLAKKAKGILTAINTTKSIVSKIGIFNEKHSCITIGSVNDDTNEFLKNKKKFSWYNEVKKSVYNRIILTTHNDPWVNSKTSSLVVSFIRDLISSLSTFQHVGYIEIQQPYSMIEDICKIDSSSGMKVIVFNRNAEIVYPYNVLKTNESAHYTSLYNLKEGIVKRPWDNVKELVYTAHSDYTDWTIVVTQPKDDFMKPVYFIRNIILLSGIILISGSLLIVYFITKTLTTPIRDLRKKLKYLSMDNLIISFDESSNDEIMLFQKALENTLERLKESLNKTIQAKSGEAHAIILALQAQMNPHFIYNTLMGISSVASQIECREIVMMCTQLSDILRYTSDFNCENVNLASEIKHAESYLKLWKWRYQEMFEYQIDIPDDIRYSNVPKLILQPIVENCFIHGFKNIRPPYRIKISGYIKDKTWIIEVCDNGCGFQDHIICRIFEQVEQYRNDAESGRIFEKLKIGGLGMINIFTRLKLLYGNSAIFQIANMSEGGAKVIVGGICEVKAE